MSRVLVRVVLLLVELLLLSWFGSVLLLLSLLAGLTLLHGIGFHGVGY